jgi:LPXTG-site transpeptidase (sortase) family protein
MSNKKAPVPQSQIVSLYRNALMHGVPLDTVEESIHLHLERLEVTEKVEASQEKVVTPQLANTLHPAIRLGAFFLPLIFITFGLYLVASAVIPIVSYYFQGQLGDMAQLTSPIPSEDVMDVTPLVITQANAQGETAEEKLANHTPRIIDVELDYTDLSNWFDAATVSQLQFNTPSSDASTYYVLDVPKLNIQNAKVEIGGTDLNKSLIAYPGTAKPGEFGAPVIFGHSVLRQFYNPSEKNSRRYNSIFSTIMTLQKGDELFITYDGVKYTYIVQEKTEVKPTDVYILSQKYDGQRLKLVTCTPEGTYLRRGVVTAQLVKTEG